MQPDEDRMWTDPNYQPVNSSRTAPPRNVTPRKYREKPREMENSRYTDLFDNKRQSGQPTTTRSMAQSNPRNTWFDYGLNYIGLSRSHQNSVKEALASVEYDYQNLAREVKEHSREKVQHNEEKGELRETIDTCKHTIYDLQAQLRESKDDVKQVKRQEQQKYEIKRNAYIDATNKQADERVEKAKKQYPGFIENGNKQIAQHAANANRTADQKLVGLRRECEGLELSNQDLEKRCTSFETEIERLRAQVKVMQEASLRNVEAEHWAPLSVSDIDRKLKTILSDVKQWSAKYAQSSLQNMIASPRFYLVGFRLQEEGCTGSTQGLLEKLGQNRSMSKKPGKAAALLLAALVSSVIMRRIINDPFFAFVGEDDSTLLLKSDAVGLDHIFAQLLLTDEEGARAWRCQLFRLLDPPDATLGNDAEEAKTIADNSRHEAAHHLGKVILHEAADVLIPAADCKAALASLESILLHAAELSWTFHARKQSIKVRDIDYFKSDRALCYKHTAADLETHSLHCAEVDDEPDALDDKMIVLLCNPAVVAYGTADGTDYDKSCIWRKGVVWLG